MRTILHLSDLHAGPPFDAEKGELIVQEAAEIKPDLVVISGDLVQRAEFRKQWLLVRSLIERLPTPRLIVPGNHDVPQYNQLGRYMWPFRAYRRYINRDLQPIYSTPDLVVIGLNTARSFTIEGGKLSNRKIAHLERALQSHGEGVCKIVVMHHHLVQAPGPLKERKPVIVGAEHTLEVLDRGGAELVLCGHIHTSYVGNTLEFNPDLQRGTIIAQSGTTTSRRGRLWQRGKNSFNVIEIDDQVIRISQRMYLSDIRRFAPVGEHVFPRRSAGAYYLPRPERVVTPTTPQALPPGTLPMEQP